MTTQYEADLTRERAALGAAILDCSGKQAAVLAAMLTEEDFITSLNRTCFAAIRRLVGRGQMPLEYASVVAELQSMGALKRYEAGHAYVSSLGEGIIVKRSMAKRAQEVRAAANRRKLAHKLEEVAAGN